MFSQTFGLHICRLVFPALAMIIASGGYVAGAVIAPGDRVVTVSEAPLKVGKETLAAIQPGMELTVKRVNGRWIWVAHFAANHGFRPVSGWVNSKYLVKRDESLKLRFAPYKGTVRYNYGQWWDLPPGESVVLQVETAYPVDLFVFSEEGKRAYDWAVKQGHGQVSSYIRRLTTRSAKFRWVPPDDRQYYLAVDNTDFPDGGASGSRTTDITFIAWQDDRRPAEPIAGRGLVIGRATLKFDGYEGRYERYAKPLTVVLAHKIDGAEDSEHQEIEAVSDQDGYFAFGNLRPDRRYWVKEVKGRNFTAPVPVHFSSPICSKNSEPDGRKDVLDVGHVALSVGRDGSIGCELVSPTVTLVKKASESASSIRFGSSSALDRHDWFERTFRFSGWSAKVRSDRQRIERERRDKADEGSERDTESHAEDVPMPPAPVD